MPLLPPCDHDECPEAIALEGAQDVLDSQIARQRLSDIKQAPERLISGKILDFRLSELEKN